MSDLDNDKKRLIFRSWHRGTREMDMLLGNFADAHVPAFSDVDLKLYEDVLNIPDVDLYDWYTGKTQPPANMNNGILEQFLTYQIKASRT